jgi:hypothetical protein
MHFPFIFIDPVEKKKGTHGGGLEGQRCVVKLLGILEDTQWLQGLALQPLSWRFSKQGPRLAAGAICERPGPSADSEVEVWDRELF